MSILPRTSQTFQQPSPPLSIESLTGGGCFGYGQRPSIDSTPDSDSLVNQLSSLSRVFAQYRIGEKVDPSLLYSLYLEAHLYSPPDRQQKADKAVLEELKRWNPDHGLPDETSRDSLTTQILEKSGRIQFDKDPHRYDRHYLAALSKGRIFLLEGNPTRDTQEKAEIFVSKAKEVLESPERSL